MKGGVTQPLFLLGGFKCKSEGKANLAFQSILAQNVRTCVENTRAKEEVGSSFVP